MINEKRLTKLDNLASLGNALNDSFLIVTGLAKFGENNIGTLVHIKNELIKIGTILDEMKALSEPATCQWFEALSEVSEQVNNLKEGK